MKATVNGAVVGAASNVVAGHFAFKKRPIEVDALQGAIGGGISKFGATVAQEYYFYKSGLGPEKHDISPISVPDGAALSFTNALSTAAFGWVSDNYILGGLKVGFNAVGQGFLAEYNTRETRNVPPPRSETSFPRMQKFVAAPVAADIPAATNINNKPNIEPNIDKRLHEDDKEFDFPDTSSEYQKEEGGDQGDVAMDDYSLFEVNVVEEQT